MSLTSPLIKGGITTNEVLDDDTLSASAKTVTHNAFDESQTPDPAVVFSGDVYSLSAGAKTIDLSALYTLAGGSADGTGYKVQGLFFKNLGDNVMTITAGASNGYEIFGVSGSVQVQPSGWICMYYNDSSPDVGATDEEIDVAGTGTQTFELAMILG